MSRRPADVTASLTIARDASSDERSYARESWASRSTRITSAPSSSNSVQIAEPIPPPAPVTSATLPRRESPATSEAIKSPESKRSLAHARQGIRRLPYVHPSPYLLIIH